MGRDRVKSISDAGSSGWRRKINRSQSGIQDDKEKIMCLPRRTGITQLTDDELLLFDFMFDNET